MSVVLGFSEHRAVMVSVLSLQVCAGLLPVKDHRLRCQKLQLTTQAAGKHWDLAIVFKNRESAVGHRGASLSQKRSESNGTVVPVEKGADF